MSKTKKQENKRSVLPWYIAYTVACVAGALYLNHGISLDPHFYTKTLIMSTSVFIAGMIAVCILKAHRLAGASMKKIDKMSGEDFEQYLGLLYKRKGYKVEYTPGTMDFGADLILTKNGVKTIVQAKRYRNSVGEAAVQQTLAAKGYYEADQCMVVTNSQYTPAAKELANKTGVVLIDRNLLGKSKMYI
jgi:restriction system protein